MSYEESYLELLEEVIEYGEIIEGRNGPTRSLFGVLLEVADMSTGYFPLLTTRRMHINGILGELAAFVRGSQALHEFKEWGCNYWDANAAAWPYNKGLTPEHQFVGKIYGAQWRNFNGVDQLTELIKGLKKEPHSRRHLLTTYNPAELDQGCLPPCHLLAQYSVRRGGFLDSCIYMRSVDLCVGLPTDVALYALLQIALATELELENGFMTFMLGDAHIYENHIEQVAIQLDRIPRELPTYKFEPNTKVLNFMPTTFKLSDYNPFDRIDYDFNV